MDGSKENDNVLLVGCGEELKSVRQVAQEIVVGFEKEADLAEKAEGEKSLEGRLIGDVIGRRRCMTPGVPSPDSGSQEILRQIEEQNGNELDCRVLENKIKVALAAGIQLEEPDDGEARQGELPEQVAGFVATSFGEPLGIFQAHGGGRFLSFEVQSLDDRKRWIATRWKHKNGVTKTGQEAGREQKDRP